MDMPLDIQVEHQAYVRRHRLLTEYESGRPVTYGTLAAQEGVTASRILQLVKQALRDRQRSKRDPADVWRERNSETNVIDAVNEAVY